MSKRFVELISNIMTAISNCSLYSKEHPAVFSLSEKSISIMESLYRDDALSFTILGDGLIINEEPINDKTIHVNNFMKKLKRKGIEKIVIKNGVLAEELKEFISEIAVSEKISGNYPHISSGIVEVRLGGGGYRIDEVMSENISKVQEVYQGVSRFKRLDMVGLEDVVISFIATLKQEANILRLVSPIKLHSEYTFAHNTNVAVLSIFQAEVLGIRSEVLHDIGLAGLLHDIGKMFVTKDVLEKKTRLDNREWEEMKKHPLYGAMYLATLPDVPKLAMIAAYEHHLKFDGTGYPETRKRGKSQHIISQIIAISDYFDALRTERPYRSSLEVPVILGLLHEASGKDFNPVLVNNFTLAIKKTI
ncbi:MAG: HD domain-containing phosphohydrolase [Nitrospirota bacterium]